MHNESLTIHRKLGDRARIASVLLNLGDAALADGDIADAESFFQEGLQIASQLGIKRTISLALHNLGLAALKRNDLQTSRDYLLKGLRLRDEMRDKVSLAYSLEAIAALAVAADNPDHSARLLGSAEGLREAIGAPLEHAERRRHEQLIQLVQSKLTPQVFKKDWEEGRSMPLPDAIAQAFS